MLAKSLHHGHGVLVKKFTWDINVGMLISTDIDFSPTPCPSRPTHSHKIHAHTQTHTHRHTHRHTHTHTHTAWRQPQPCASMMTDSSLCGKSGPNHFLVPFCSLSYLNLDIHNNAHWLPIPWHHVRMYYGGNNAIFTQSSVMLVLFLDRLK